ncbi:conserved hypothetical protein [Candidatus Terasakiella magnetica]|nr:conserved hypothetical protein [Candidatus Terasakiella magnetica]
MDPSLADIISQAISKARSDGLDSGEQAQAAQDSLCDLMPSLDPSIAQLIIEQLCPLMQATA